MTDAPDFQYTIRAPQIGLPADQEHRDRELEDYLNTYMGTGSGGVQVQVYDTAGTYTYDVPTGTEWLEIYVVAGGAGGMGGGKASSGGISGGPGGASGAAGYSVLQASELPTSLTVVVGAGGPGGAGAAVNGVGGSSTGGGSTRVTATGLRLEVIGGNAVTSTGGGGSAGSSSLNDGDVQVLHNGANGGAPGSTTVGGNGGRGSDPTRGSPGGGGGGGSISSGAPTTGAGGAGGSPKITGYYVSGISTQGAGGAANGGAGTNGPAGNVGAPGCGGGGGGAATSGTAGAGGNGGWPGGGGGGGGACSGGTAGGAGGNGADGGVVIVAHGAFASTATATTVNEWHWFEFDQAAETTPSTDCLLLCGSHRLDTADYSYDGSLHAVYQTANGSDRWRVTWVTFQGTLTDGWDTRLLTSPSAGDSLSLNFSRFLPALEPLLVAADSTLTGIDLRIGGPQSLSPAHWQPLGTVSFNGTTGPYLPCYGQWSNDGYCLLGYQDATTGGIKNIAHDDATVEAGQVRLGLSFPVFLPLDPSADTPVKRTSTWRTL